MGWNCSFLAADMPPEKLASWFDFAVVDTAPARIEFGEFLETPETPAWACRLARRPFSIVFANDYGATARHSNSLLGPLSEKLAAPVYIGEACEGGMTSSFALWREGRRIFSVRHDGGTQGVRHLETDGAAPPEFDAICASLFAKQDTADANVDYIFNVPADLFEACVGFKYDVALTRGATELFLYLRPSI